MELEHSFTVPVPMERAWDVLLDVERVAPCMPGATLDSVDGDEIHGKVKVKVGPINMTYAGTARFVEKDKATGVMRLEASGKETKGAGTASATVRSTLEDHGHETFVVVHTTLNVTGKPAQFGRGVMNEVGGKLLSIFATNLASMLAQSNDEAAGAGAAAGAPAGAAAAATGEAGVVGAGTASAPSDSAAVDDLHLTGRALASLHREGITTIGQLAAKTDDELLGIDGIGPASVEEIKTKLAERGPVLAQAASSQAPSSQAASATSAGPTSPNGAAAMGGRSADDARTGSPAAAADRGADTARVQQDEALNLLSVAGLPVLKRALPIVVGLTAVLILALRRRWRHRAR
jgi:carbon monoxide dehydrogenase subunit G